MFSKAAFLFILSLGLSGCDLNLNAKSPESSLRISGMTCLSQIGAKVSDYIDDKLSEGEIVEFFGCMQKSFIMFETYVRGSNQGEYTPEEIRAFLEKRFLKDQKISDQLLKEFMIIKNTLVGGGVDVIQRQDLRVAVSILDTLKNEALRLKPYLRLLNVRLVDKEPRENLAERLSVAHKKLHESIEVIVELLAKAQQPYSIQNFENVITELRQFVRWDHHFRGSRPIALWMNFFRNFKSVAVSPTDRIKATEWAPLLTASANWYMLFIEVKSLLSFTNIWEASHLAQLNTTVSKGLRWLKDAIARQPGKVIEFARLSELYGSVEKMGWTSSMWPQKAVDKITEAVVTKLLGESELPPQQRKARGLTGVHVSRFEQEVMQWYEYQLQIESNTLANTTFFPTTQLYMDSVKGIYLTEFNPHGFDMNRFNQTVSNALRSVANLVIRGYAAQPKKGLTREELQFLYLDLRDLLIAWKLADPREFNTGKRAYLEGNLFTYSANGDEFLDRSELMQLLAFLKAGGQLGALLYGELYPYCYDAELDVYGEKSLLRGCVEQRLTDVLGQLTPNMPGFTKFFQNLGRKQRLELVKDVLETIYSRNSKPEVVESSEITAFAAILQYQEAVFTRYNHNADNALNGAELDTAFETFRGLLKMMAKMTCVDLSDSRTRLTFNYILNYHEIPEPTLETWLIFQRDETPKNIDRIKLNKVFKALIRKIIESGGQPPACQ